MKVKTEDFKKANENILYRKTNSICELAASQSHCFISSGAPAHLMFLGDGAFSQNCQLNYCLRWPEACMFVNGIGLKPLANSMHKIVPRIVRNGVNFMLGHLIRVNPLNV